MSFNKIVIAEFLQVEELIDEKDGAKKYQSFVNSYNYEKEHGRINGMTPAEKWPPTPLTVVLLKSFEVIPQKK
jgi:hypothetical protein